jgi:two-component system chemotaxis response regulator CheY
MTADVDFPRLSVLIIDDDPSVRGVASTMLRRMAIPNVVMAESGDQALKLFQTVALPFDLIICDWDMPGMNGMEVYTQLRADHPKLPFLMLTGRNDLDSVITARGSGVSGYLVKPFSPQQLKDKISFVMGIDAAGLAQRSRA